MVVSDTVLQAVDETPVCNVVQMRLQVFELNAEEAVFVIVSAAMQQEIVDGELALLARRNEDERRFCQCVFQDGEVGRLRHCDHERREVRDGEALEVNIHVEGSGATKEGKYLIKTEMV